MQQRRLVIAGTGSGVGKTTVTIGLMAALKKKGLTVQGFKCGPDYIDPSYHTAVTKRHSRNLDSWMLEEDVLKEVLLRGSGGADISIMEGVMGLFDGRDPTSNEGSTADVSLLTSSPILLVVNCASMARSAAAIVKGFQQLTEGTNIVGVIANKVGSKGHYELVKTAIEQECGIPVVGYLKRELGIEIPERSLGLVPSVERGELDPFFEQLGELISETVDLERILELSVTTPIHSEGASSIFHKEEEKVVTIAIPKDSAFNSYYIENLEVLEAAGAELVYFSPLEDESLPNGVDGIYIGGGLPEEFIHTLAKNETTKRSMRDAMAAGLPIFAEGGGFMYLTEKVETTAGEIFSMVGVIPGKITYHQKLKAIGYREITGQEGNFLIGAEEKAKGHEFHYSTFEKEENLPHAYESIGRFGAKQEGVLSANLVAGYTQFHFGSNPQIAKNFIEACKNRRS